MKFSPRVFMKNKLYKPIYLKLTKNFKEVIVKKTIS